MHLRLIILFSIKSLLSKSNPLFSMKILFNSKTKSSSPPRSALTYCGSLWILGTSLVLELCLKFVAALPYLHWPIYFSLEGVE